MKVQNQVNLQQLVAKRPDAGLTYPVLPTAAERSERARLEKENAKLLARAFEAPSTALLEVRSLTSELYSLRCEKANAELREAEASRKVAALISRVWLIAHAAVLVV